MPPSGVDYASEFLNGYAPEYVIILAACSLIALAGKPRVKKATKKTAVTQQKKQTENKRDTLTI